jgi:hypothetical protein
MFTKSGVGLRVADVSCCGIPAAGAAASVPLNGFGDQGPLAKNPLHPRARSGVWLGTI